MAKLGLNHGLHQRQDMVLAPRMLQAIEVLALPGADLEGWLMEQAEGNEALVVEAPAEAPVGDRQALEPARSRAAAARASDDHHALLEAQPDRRLSLSDTVEEQMATREVATDVRGWVSFLVGCLDPAGLLGASDEELMELDDAEVLWYLQHLPHMDMGQVLTQAFNIKDDVIASSLLT